VAGNRIELWGRIPGEPELRTTPAGTSVLRMLVGADSEGDLALAVVASGELAQQIGPQLKAGFEVKVSGMLKAVRRRLKSGLTEVVHEVVADSIVIGGPTGSKI